MKYTIILIFTSLLFLFCLNSKGQTVYGVTGIIKVPNAYTVDDGKCNMGIGYLRDDHDQTNNLLNLWSVNFNIGFLTRFEFGARLMISKDIKGDSPIFDEYFDRIVSGKFILIREKNKLPQIAFGMQDIVGTRYHNSTYLVVSKNLQLNNLFCILLDLGYGTKLNDRVFSDARNHNFIGIFGGCEMGYKKRIYLMTEYDAKDINSGLKIVVRDWLNFNFSLLKMEIPSAGLSLKFTI